MLSHRSALGVVIIVAVCGVGVAFTGCGSSGGGESGGENGGDAGASGQGGSGLAGNNSGGSSGSGGTSVIAGHGGAGGQDAGPCAHCSSSFKCRYDTCVPDLGTCTTHDDCPGDSYCDPKGECIPYGVPPSVINDPACKRENPPDGVKPTVQCEWIGPTSPNDPSAASTKIYSTPMVADLNLDDDPDKLQPSIVVSTFASSTNGGTLRIFDGRTCKEQLHIGGEDDGNWDNRAGYATQWAIADLDGDVPTGGKPEIIGFHRTTTDVNGPLALYAFKLDSTGTKSIAKRMWYGRTCKDNKVVALQSGVSNIGAGVWDINDDGKPEILVDQMVFDATGCLLNANTDQSYLRLGMFPTIADVDLDGAPELVRYNRVAGWDDASHSWKDKPWFKAKAAAQKPGSVAVVDLGQYSVIPGHAVPNKLPEVIVVSAQDASHFNPGSTGTIRVQSIDGTVIWGPMELYHSSGKPGGHGGPPTAADFDGDGQPEFAAAANEFYTVYDPDCVAALGGKSPTERPGGKCDRAPGMKNLPDGILWAQPSQDYSSSVTGSSVFDFNGDGHAEAVYGDECYVRVYEGATGNVLFSAPASSGTGYELPVIADVDGDFATEIVVVRTPGLACPSPDPLFPGSGPAVQRGGFVVLRDPHDRWAASRPIWNQHAYSVTHISDQAVVPKSSQMKPNWTQPGLNNFRQNTQGSLGMLEIADLTVVLDQIGDLCQGQSGTRDLHAKVCNRGTNPVQDGATVRFVEVPKGATGGDGGIPAGKTLCEVSTSKLLKPGDCEVVTCSGDLSGQGDVYVVVDPENKVADCHPGNNDGAGSLALCPR